jgi:hypothetical protein
LPAEGAPRSGNNREEEKVNGKESEETREKGPEEDDDEVVRPQTNLDLEALRSRRGAFFCWQYRLPVEQATGQSELPVRDSSWAGQISV